MFTFIAIILIIVSIALIGIVLLQPGKGDLSSSFGGGLSGQFGAVFGMRKTTDLLTKITIGLAAAIILLSLATNKLFLSNTATVGPKPVTEGVELPATQGPSPLQAPPAQQAPAAPQQPQQ